MLNIKNRSTVLNVESVDSEQWDTILRVCHHNPTPPHKIMTAQLVAV